jgi:hypothetical protein
MTTIDHSGPDADDLAARSRANDTLTSLMDSGPADASDAERLRLAVDAHGRAMAKVMNERAQKALFSAFSDLFPAYPSPDALLKT